MEGHAQLVKFESSKREKVDQQFHSLSLFSWFVDVVKV